MGLPEDVAEAYARWWPQWASEHGLTAHDGRLADPSPEGLARVADEARSLLGRVDEGTLEGVILAHGLRVTVFEIEELKLHERNPDLAMEVSEHLFGLLAKPGGRTPEEVFAGLAARLEGVPRFLAEGRRRVDVPSVPRLWAEVALESAEHAPDLLATIRRAAKDADLPADLAQRLDRALAGARDAVAGHRAWLEKDVLPNARGTHVLGRERLDRLLDVRQVGADSDTLWALAHERVEAEARRTREAALAVLHAHGRPPGPEPVLEALALARADHPKTFEDVLEAYRRAIDEAREHVVREGIAAPADEPCRVVETPSYLRHLIPFAAYMDPGRWARRPEGLYLVTPKEDLSAFPRADVRTTTVHEAWPGHHLQLAHARRIPLANFLQEATEYIEGWALYCEELMLRRGFLRTPEERFLVAKDSFWRAIRIRLDVGLATGRVAYDEAVRELMVRVGFSKEEAEAEVKRYTLEPGYNLSYMWGKLRILDLRERLVDSGRMDERAFHDAVLGAGALPFPLLERALAVKG